MKKLLQVEIEITKLEREGKIMKMMHQKEVFEWNKKYRKTANELNKIKNSLF